MPCAQLDGDPTYNEAEIKSNPVWHVAWVLAQCKDDNAPIGWSRWIWVAEAIIKAQNGGVASQSTAIAAKATNKRKVKRPCE